MSPLPNRRPILATLSVLGIALATSLAGCSGGGEDTSTSSGSEPDSSQSSNESPAEESDGTVTLAVVGTIQAGGWDPSNQPRFQNYPATAVWDTLIRNDEFGKPLPGAAESFEFSDDNKSITAHLREGMLFSDGTPLTAESVKASFEYMSNGGSAARFADLTYDIPDEHTITVTWPDPQPTIALTVSEPYISSEKWLEEGNPAEKPVGSGPYILDEANTTDGSVYTLTKNVDYWDADNLKFDTVVVKIMESETAVVNALKTNQVDGALLGASSYDEVTNAGLESLVLAAEVTRMLITDHKGEVIPALGDVKVRQAMNMILDKQAMADKIFLGYAKPVSQIFREGSDAYIENLEDPYPFDVDKAKKLMEEAGYADGFDLQIPTMAGQNFENILPYITQQFSLINIRIEEVPLTGPNAILDLLSGTYPVPMWQLGNYGESLQDVRDYLLPEGTWNVLHQKDETIDKIWKEIVKTSDPDKLKDLEQEANQYVVDQAWFIPIVAPERFFVHNSKIKLESISDFNGTTPFLWDFE